MKAVENMHEVRRFSNIYILSHIIYYIHPLTLIIVLTIKAVAFLQCIMVISKIKYEFFYLNFLLFQIKKFITTCFKRWKEKHRNVELISRFKYA